MGEEEGGGVRSGPGAARTILRFHTISARPPKQPLMVRTLLKVYGARLPFFVSARTNKRHHHHIDHIQTRTHLQIRCRNAHKKKNTKKEKAQTHLEMRCQTTQR